MPLLNLDRPDNYSDSDWILIRISQSSRRFGVANCLIWCGQKLRRTFYPYIPYVKLFQFTIRSIEMSKHAWSCVYDDLIERDGNRCCYRLFAVAVHIETSIVGLMSNFRDMVPWKTMRFAKKKR